MKNKTATLERAAIQTPERAAIQTDSKDNQFTLIKLLDYTVSIFFALFMVGTAFYLIVELLKLSTR